MAKIGEQKKVTIDGIEYTLQFPGVREVVRMRDRNKNNVGQLVEEKYYEDVMKNVIVDPKTNWDYWEEHDGFKEIMDEAATFLND
ncbi:hypothetical protein NST70_13675 [Weizmannia sp. FSL K6-0777]|uniref:hypothetical protein n=1 Tax=Heyndrickxia TaxID=2837504 RepID=UPI002E1A9180|nr:hypothetical protein [Weizmannia sp. CD-2023]